MPASHAASLPPPIESFFQRAILSGAKLSPNGRFVAIRIASKESRARLAVLDLETMVPTSVASFADADIGRFLWVNDQRLVFDLTDLQLPQGELFGAPGLFAVNRDGGAFRQLVERVYSFVKSGNSAHEYLPWNTFLLQTIGKQDTGDVLVIKPESYDRGNLDYLNLQRLNTLNGRAVTLDTPLHSDHWLIDQSGTPRIAMTAERNLRAMHYNDPATGQWRKLAEFDRFTGDGVVPVFYGPDGSFYVSANKEQDKAAIYAYDLVKNRIGDKPFIASADYDINGKPFIASADYDIDGGFIVAKSKILGVRYQIDAEVTQWFDETMKATQDTVDALLPNTINRIAIAQRPEMPYVLVTAFSDVQPEIFLLFNTATKKLAKLGGVNPDVDPKQMARKDMVRYKARDGLEIPAYLTLPKGAGKKNLPLVVLVHGGTWRWEPEAQFLASRGYAVLEPEFRGSTGFGSKHFAAGWKQWGLAMQNDIADGAKWAIAEGIVDPKRICIAGASYGGYATLMGLINDPELFRCGIDWVGVTDINLMYTIKWSDFSDVWKQYGMPALIGDPVKDAAQLKATSPLENAARIKQPLLLAYGGADRRVPIEHGTRLYNAVKTGNPNVEWVVYDQEGHGWAELKNRVDFWTRVEKFLDRNIGKP